MFSKIYNSISDNCLKYKKNVFVSLFFLIIAAVTSLFFLRLDNSMDAMIPAKSDVVKSINFLREADMAGKVALSISLKEEGSRSELIKISDILKKKLNSGPVTEVVNGIDDINLDQMFEDIKPFVPQTLSDEDFVVLEKSLDSEVVEQKVKTIYKRLLMPGPSQSSMLFADPLGLYTNYFFKIQTLIASFAYKVEIVDGHFLSADNKNALLILSTEAAITDSMASKELLTHIEAVLADYSSQIDTQLVCGHSHTISNEKAIKSDVKRISIVALLAFFILFAFVFKDPKAVAVFILPFTAILMAIALNSLWISSMSYLIIGFAVVMAGISIDYAIHIYYAVQKTNKEQLCEVAKPVIVGALTTMGVFIAFFFSSVQGYKQLALFSIVSLLISLVLALFVLPLLLDNSKFDKDSKPAAEVKCLPKFCSLKIGLWGGLIYVAWLLMGTLSIGSDIRSFDGSEKEIWQSEAAFDQIWAQKTQPLILVLQGKNLSSLIEQEEVLYKDLEKQKAEGLLALSYLWPSKDSRIKNLKRWNALWTAQVKNKLSQDLKTSSKKFAFKNGVFDEFIAGLAKTNLSDNILPTDMPLLNLLVERFYSQKDMIHRLIIYLDDTQENLILARKLILDNDNLFLVSREEIARTLSASVFDEILKLAKWALAFIVFIAFVLLRNIRKTILAMVPVLTAVMVMGAVLALSGIGITAITVVAALIVLGLAVDYGIFVVYHEFSVLSVVSNKAVTLSAITTVIGAGALLWAKHPVMYSIGLTLVSGVIAGYLSAIIVVPALSYMTSKK